MKVAQSCPTLCNSMGYTVHGILQARILEWVAVPFSRGSPQPRDWSQVSHTAGGFCSNIPHVPLKNYKRSLLSSLPFEDPVIYSAQDSANLFGQSLEGQLMPTPLLLNCWVLIADSHFTVKSISSLVQVWGGWRPRIQLSIQHEKNRKPLLSATSLMW